MQTENLPTDDLKKFGIINEDLSFSKKLTDNDIQKFLQGYTIVADNDKNRATFQLVKNNTELKVNFLERNKNLSDILEKSRNKIQYSDTFSKYDVSKQETAAQLNWSKTAFIYDKETNSTVEFDLIKNRTELTAIISDKMDVSEMSRYKNELLELKNFLLDKVDQYPEIAKEITTDVNIVSKEINTVNSISFDQKQFLKGNDSGIHLNVNDKDLYEDANRMKAEEEQEEEIHKTKGRGR